jgi:hypothetical protein
VAGRIGIASQSGAYGTHLYSLARNRMIGTPLCVTTGNEGDVALGRRSGLDGPGEEVDVICAYAEGIRDSETFLAALELARTNRKPIVMMKVGRSVLGGQGAQSHTASIAGDDAVTDAVLAEFGVVRARNTEELLDIAYAATKRIYPGRHSLGVVTVSGGAACSSRTWRKRWASTCRRCPRRRRRGCAASCPSARRATRWTARRRPSTRSSWWASSRAPWRPMAAIRLAWASSPRSAAPGPWRRRCGRR